MQIEQQIHKACVEDHIIKRYSEYLYNVLSSSVYVGYSQDSGFIYEEKTQKIIDTLKRIIRYRQIALAEVYTARLSHSDNVLSFKEFMFGEILKKVDKNQVSSEFCNNEKKSFAHIDLDMEILKSKMY